MKPVDLHPDDLLDRARGRQLTPAEATRLRAHTRDCSACALELAWLADDLHERSPSEEDALRAQRAVRRLWGETDDQSRLTTLVRPRKPRWANRSAPMLALGVLLSASAAAAAFSETGMRWIVEHVAPIVGRSPATRVPANEAAPARVRPRVAPARQLAREDSPRSVSAPVPESQANDAQESPSRSQLQAPDRNSQARRSPRIQAAPAELRPRAEASTRAIAPAAAPQPTADVPPQPAPQPEVLAASRDLAPPIVRQPPVVDSSRDLAPPAVRVVDSSPAEPAAPPIAASRPSSPTGTTDAAIARLREAQRARAAGDVDQALALYASLARDFPGSRAERGSRVSRGRLLLDERRDAAAALASFDRYLAEDAAGALAEEARLGRARALELLGERARAAEAWRALLHDHPGSIHAAVARRRLRELEP